MQLEDHEGSVNTIVNCHFADDIIVHAEEEEEADVMVDYLKVQNGETKK